MKVHLRIAISPRLVLWFSQGRVAAEVTDGDFNHGTPSAWVVSTETPRMRWWFESNEMTAQAVSDGFSPPVTFLIVAGTEYAAPLWPFVLLTGVPGVWMLVKTRTHTNPNACLACGYDRTGLPQSSTGPAPCPECGKGECNDAVCGRRDDTVKR